MNDIKVLWTEVNFLSKIFIKIFKYSISLFLLKKINILIFFNKNFYFYLFNILKLNSFFKINTLSDIIAIHYPGDFYEFEIVYVCISYRLNFRIFFKLFFKNEDLIISLNQVFKSAS
jgi:NADH:ubiquinone oxidoreductase subunit C